MKKFMDEDFLLSNETAKKLFHTYGKDMPIIDYHCHIPPQEIYEVRNLPKACPVPSVIPWFIGAIWS